MKDLVKIVIALSMVFAANVMAASAAPDSTVIHAGTVISDGPDSRRKNQSIIVENGRIKSIRDGFLGAGDARLVDLSSSYVMPGLIDVHVHLQFGGARLNRDLVEMEDAVVVLRAYAEAKRSLMAGFTTLRDMAGDPDVIFGLRDAINQGHVVGPRILSAGPAIMPTGGGVIRGLRRDILEVLEYTNLEYPCDGADECRKAVRRVLKDGGDFIKIVATASITAPGEGGLPYQMTVDELDAVVNTAHALNKKVSAHAHGLEGIIMALNVGVDSIEHGTFGDRTTVDLFKEANAFLVPTPLVDQVEAAKASDTMSLAQRQKLIRANEHWFSMLRLADAGGVKIAFGTDTQVGMHGNNARNFLIYRDAGMSNTEIIRSATVNAAELLGLDQEIGTIEVGKVADIIAVDEDPTMNIEALLDVRYVMKSGNTVKLH